MKAVNKPSYDTNRNNLWDVVPLSSPYSCFIEPTRMCNLKCYYCIHFTRGIIGGEMERQGVPLKHIDMGLFDKIVNDIMDFPEQPKRITFSGLGEPLLNPNLGEMTRRLRSAGFAGRVDVITNGVALTSELSDELVDSGVTRIMISVQGLSSEAYKEITGVAIDMRRYIDNIRYLYEHKRDTQIYIKIIDANLKNECERKDFFNVFGDICDQINIEHLLILEKQTMSFRTDAVDHTVNFSGEPAIFKKICSEVFYFLQVCIDGNVYPCAPPGLPQGFALGNMHRMSLLEIWRSARRLDLLLGNLRDGFRANPFCGECDCANFMNAPEENLDPFADELLQRLEKK